jgi:hypothetical protein
VLALLRFRTFERLSTSVVNHLPVRIILFIVLYSCKVHYLSSISFMDVGAIQFSCEHDILRLDVSVSHPHFRVV